VGPKLSGARINNTLLLPRELNSAIDLRTAVVRLGVTRTNIFGINQKYNLITVDYLLSEVNNIYIPIQDSEHCQLTCAYHVTDVLFMAAEGPADDSPNLFTSKGLPISAPRRLYACHISVARSVDNR
jgi:hypothetical protein